MTSRDFRSYSWPMTRNSRIEEDLIDQLFNSSERRLARLLLLLANFGKEGSPQPINPHISQETLAEMVGTTRSRVSHFMNKFRLRLSSSPHQSEQHHASLNKPHHLPSLGIPIPLVEYEQSRQRTTTKTSV